VIVVDSSAFVEYFRPSGNSKVRHAVAQAIAADQVAVNGIIEVEIVAFAREEAEYRRLAAHFRAFQWIELGRAVFEQAAGLGATLRRKGITVQAADLIIAASAIEAGAQLYHTDSDYDQIARHSALQAENLSRR